MKLFILIPIIFMFSVLADQPDELGSFRITDGEHQTIDNRSCVYSQTWNYSEWVTGYSNYGAGDRWVCDDFILTDDCTIDSIVVWEMYPGGRPSWMNIVFSEDTGDSDPNTAVEVWSASAPCQNWFTGQPPYDSYKTTIFVIESGESPPELSAGTRYWLEVQADIVDNCFLLVCRWANGSFTWYNDGSGVWVRSDIMFGVGTDAFFDLYGYETSALESSTWGSIKTLF
ncbi:MAG: hypothetical protein KAW14_06420 [Candidatus Aegiribacteria sp.]|nr:hypothetical protein [Candidatus Aegiribacteria sp.]